jgi:hypothetical protein
MLALMASFLDPRMKGGVGILDKDHNEIYDNIRQHVIGIANEDLAQLDNQAQQLEEQAEALHVPREIQPPPLDDMDIFDELDNNYQEEV